MQFIATYANSAFTGLGILDIAYGIDDRLKIVAWGVDHYTRPTWHKIYTDNEGRDYIRKYRCRYYLDEFMRCN